MYIYIYIYIYIYELITSIVNASNYTKSVKNARFNLTLLIYIFMNTIKNYTAIILRLN